MKTRLRDIKLFDLDGQTVLQISKFVRRANSQDGVSIRLNDPWVVRKLIYHAQNTDDAELGVLFRAIQCSLMKYYGSQLNFPMDVEGKVNKTAMV